MCWITPDMEFLILHSICSPPKLSAAAETLHAVCRTTFNCDPSLSTSSLVSGLVIPVFFCIKRDVIWSISFLMPSSTEFLLRRCPPGKLRFKLVNKFQIFSGPTLCNRLVRSALRANENIAKSLSISFDDKFPSWSWLLTDGKHGIRGASLDCTMLVISSLALLVVLPLNRFSLEAYEWCLAERGNWKSF